MIALILFTIFVMFMVRFMVKPRKFPPGPMWYPLVGSSSKLYSMTKKHGSQFKAFLELSKEYSTKALGLNLGGELVVVFFGLKNVRETLLAEEFDGRPDDFFLRLRCFGMRAGISVVDGPIWKIHRNFALKHLRNAGYGKDPMEKDIQGTMLDLADMITKQDDQPISPKDFLSLSVINVLWKYAAGEKIGEEKWNYLQGLLQKRSKTFTLTGGLLNRVPWTRFILPGYTGYSMLIDVNKQISAIIEETILKHKNREVERNDFINAFLREMAVKRETFTDDQLKVVLLDFILAGSSTTSYTVEFAILQVLRDQEMQMKIQAEIDMLLEDEVPSWSDSLRLIYTSAFLLEVQRLYTVFPLHGPRRVLKETVVDGYVIPKNTTVLMSVGDIHVDPDLWEDPQVFKPERFIDDNGQLKQAEHLYAFGLGRRRCPGDTLARMYIFITFTGILQRFSISCADQELPSNEPDIGMMASAKRFRAVFTPRKNKSKIP